jgi:uncharacterized OB-fold protein
METKLGDKPEQGKKQIPAEEGVFYQPQAPGEEPYLIAARCKECGFTDFPGTPVCPRCVKRGTMEEVHIGRKGKLDTFSIVRSALPGFVSPSVQAYVNLEEGPRIWSLITGVEPLEEALKIGMDLELVISKVREDADGNEIISYQYRPVKGS